MSDAARALPPLRMPRLRAVGLGWLALSALAIAVFAPLPYLLNPLHELAANGGEIAANYAPRAGGLRAVFAAHVVSAASRCCCLPYSCRPVSAIGFPGCTG